jgi:hypothetical protein
MRSRHGQDRDGCRLGGTRVQPEQRTRPRAGSEPASRSGAQTTCRVRRPHLAGRIAFVAGALYFHAARLRTSVRRRGTGLAGFAATNPVGTGFFLDKRSADGQRVPNIEDPRQLIGAWDDRPAPAGCGFVAPSWLPRRAYAGTYDERWQEEQFPLLPADFDMRFFNCASSGLVCDGFLVGDEPVELLNLSPHGPLSFRLPGIAIWMDALLRGQRLRYQGRIWTVILEPELARFSVVWGCSIEVGAQPSRLTEIVVSSTWLDPSRLRAA